MDILAIPLLSKYIFVADICTLQIFNLGYVSFPFIKGLFLVVHLQDIMKNAM